MVNVLNKSTNPRFRYSFGKTLSFFFRAPNFILGESLSQYDNQTKKLHILLLLFANAGRKYLNLPVFSLLLGHQ
jgi:hypothetical protein